LNIKPLVKDFYPMLQEFILNYQVVFDLVFINLT